MRNSHVFPKVPHLEADARLPPDLGVAVGACVKHPRRSRGASGAAAWGREHRGADPSYPHPQHRPSRRAAAPSEPFGQAFLRGAGCPVVLDAPGLKKVLVVIPDAKFE